MTDMTLFHMGYNAFRYGLSCPEGLTKDQKAEWIRGWNHGVYTVILYKSRQGVCQD